MVAGAPVMFAEYDSEALEIVLQGLPERYNQVLRARIDNEFEIDHAGTAKG